MKELLFVYNADSSIYPKLIHSDEWLSFSNELSVPIRCLTEDEVHRDFTGIRVEAPSLIVKNGHISELATRDDFDKISDLAGLVDLIKSKGY
jgi:hypothetical protein